MKQYYPEPRRRSLSHPVRSLLATAALVYSGWVFRGCAENPETVAYRLNRGIAKNPARYEALTDKELSALYALKGRVHRKHAVEDGCVHPSDVSLVWKDTEGKDCSVLQLRNGHQYALRRAGLQESLEPISGLEQVTKGDEHEN